MINKRLIQNWNTEAESYGRYIKAEYDSFRRAEWIKFFVEHIGEDRKKILDVGTGPGFFSILLSELGHDVIGIDATENMIKVATRISKEYGVNPEFKLQDVHSTDFQDETFDIVVGRNVVWTLADAKTAYKEWLRILKPGGKIMIFDGNWNRYHVDEESRKAFEIDEANYIKKYNRPINEGVDVELMLEYNKKAPMNHNQRPQWDIKTLLDLKCSKIYCERDLSEKIFDEEEKIKYRSRPMFLVVATK